MRNRKSLGRSGLVVALNIGFQYSINHSRYFFICAEGEDLDRGMMCGKHPKDFICKCLTDGVHICEVEEHRLEFFNTRQQTLGLRARNQVLTSVLG